MRYLLLLQRQKTAADNHFKTIENQQAVCEARKKKEDFRKKIKIKHAVIL